MAGLTWWAHGQDPQVAVRGHKTAVSPDGVRQPNKERQMIIIKNERKQGKTQTERGGGWGWRNKDAIDRQHCYSREYQVQKKRNITKNEVVPCTTAFSSC